MFWLGMLTMYLISGIIIGISEAFGDGVLDEWLYYLFCWWFNFPLLLIVIIIKKIKKTIDKKSKK